MKIITRDTNLYTLNAKETDFLDVSWISLQTLSFSQENIQIILHKWLPNQKEYKGTY